MSDLQTSSKLNDEDYEPESPSPSDKYYFDDGDIILRSSDNVDFKVHKYQLMAASTVFRSMLQVPNLISDSTIELTDPDIESSISLEYFFGLIYDGKMPPRDPQDLIGYKARLGRILTKYDCKRDLAIFYQNLVTDASSRNVRDLQATFVLAAIFEKPYICALAIEHGWEPGVSPQSGVRCDSLYGDLCGAKRKEQTLGFLDGGLSWNLGSLPLRWYSAIKTEYHFAYDRARWPQQGEDGWVIQPTAKQVAQNLVRLLA